MFGFEAISCMFLGVESIAPFKNEVRPLMFFNEAQDFFQILEMGYGVLVEQTTTWINMSLG